MKRDLTLTLSEACAARGLDPASYRTPQQKFTALDRLIPGKAERIAPSILIAQRRPELKNINARSRYTETAAAKHASMIRDGGTEAYVALFCQLNNLVQS